MTSSGMDPTLVALRRLRERIRFFFEAAATNEGDEVDPDYFPDVLAQEVAYVVQEGPAAYLQYLGHLDEAAVRADLDEHLELILRDGDGGS